MWMPPRDLCFMLQFAWFMMPLKLMHKHNWAEHENRPTKGCLLGHKRNKIQNTIQIALNCDVSYWLSLLLHGHIVLQLTRLIVSGGGGDRTTDTFLARAGHKMSNDANVWRPSHSQRTRACACAIKKHFKWKCIHRVGFDRGVKANYFITCHVTRLYVGSLDSFHCIAIQFMFISI